MIKLELLTFSKLHYVAIANSASVRFKHKEK